VLHLLITVFMIQDFDNGFRRLMTGSFEPVVDPNWSRDVYYDPVLRAQTEAAELEDFAEKQKIRKEKADARQRLREQREKERLEKREASKKQSALAKALARDATHSPGTSKSSSRTLTDMFGSTTVPSAATTEDPVPATITAPIPASATSTPSSSSSSSSASTPAIPEHEVPDHSKSITTSPAPPATMSSEQTTLAQRVPQHSSTASMPSGSIQSDATPPSPASKEQAHGDATRTDCTSGNSEQAPLIIKETAMEAEGRLAIVRFLLGRPIPKEIPFAAFATVESEVQAIIAASPPPASPSPAILATDRTCSICNLTFASRNLMFRHMRLGKHANSTSPATAPTTTTTTTPVDTTTTAPTSTVESTSTATTSVGTEPTPVEQGSLSIEAHCMRLSVWLFQHGHIDQATKGRIKDLALAGNNILFGAVHAFSIDQDIDELVDTINRIP
jgi:hypothetical protein